MWYLGIKLDGYSEDYFGLVFLKDHYHPLSPEMRNKTMSIPGMSGEWDFGSEWGSRPFNLPFSIIEYDRNERQRKLRAFVAFLLDSKGKPREVKLSFDYEPDKYYTVKLATKIDIQRLLSTSDFTIPFVAHKPEAKFIAPTDEITMGSDVPVMSDITIGAQYEFKVTSNRTITVINDGYLSVRPTILISGYAGSLSMTINGETFTFSTINSPIEINAEKYTVKVNGVSTLSAMTGDISKLLLSPGENDIVLSGTNLSIDLTFRFNHQYI